jgi:hypothetical protein
MKALTHLAVFPFDYLFDGYLAYIWLVLAAIVFVMVVILLELRLFERYRPWKSDSAPQKRPPSPEPPGSFDPSSLKKSIDDLKKEQEILIKRFATVQELVRGMQVEIADLKANNDSRHQNYTQQHDQHERYSGAPIREYAKVSSTSPSTPAYHSQRTAEGREESCSDMTNLYNESRTDQATRERFREKYKPFLINVANDLERRRNMSVPPDFRKEGHGSYLAVLRELDEALIFPDFTLVVIEAVYGPGAFADVFDCGTTFDHRFSYPNLRVAVPATFRSTGGQNWEVIQKGKLDLGAGQDDQSL